MTILDAYNRPISYLRISVTDRCNLRCVYCMPAEGVPWQPHRNILRYEEIETVARAAAELGITKVRLTGGEPLVRQGIVGLVRSLARIPGISDLAMTTNGTLLARYASELADAGLRRVNVSLDTLRSERFASITRGGRLEDALEGIEAARAAGLVPVKINMVVMRGINDDEVVEFARRTYAEEWHVRFIELMPVGSATSVGGDWRARCVAGAEIRRSIEDTLGRLEPATVGIGSGPAQTYRLPGARGTIGLITPISEHFCYGCNRLRLTADGRLRPCLMSEREIDLRIPLRRGAGVEGIKALLACAVERKPLRHHLDTSGYPGDRLMCQVGG